jgi:hypothetical protein
MYRKSLKSAFVILLFLVWGFFAFSASTSVLLTGSFGDSHVTGVYSTGWNAGIVSFTWTPAGYSWSEVVGLWASSLAYLTGIFWMETTGWATFSDVWAGWVILIPPGTGSSVREPWYLSGYAWSENAGWIKFNHGESFASGVAFLPDSASLIGYAWNDSLGWIPFGSWAGIAVDQAFIGKISVWWNIASKKTFSTLYTPGNIVEIQGLNTFLWQVRKNVTIISRNAEKNNKINTLLPPASIQAFNNSIVYNLVSNPWATFIKYSQIVWSFDGVDSVRSFISIGADIYIDTNVVASPFVANLPRALISLKNDAWQWWNIYIKGSVKNIEASLVADGTIWSGEEFLTGALSPYVVSKKSVFLDLPRTQLYVKWLLASYNTIWWAGKDGWASCPVFTRNWENCTYDTAIPYDWNYFRAYDSSVAANRAYPNTSKDQFSVVMEPDPRLVNSQSPRPPGLETITQ